MEGQDKREDTFIADPPSRRLVEETEEEEFQRHKRGVRTLNWIIGLTFVSGICLCSGLYWLSSGNAMTEEEAKTDVADLIGNDILEGATFIEPEDSGFNLIDYGPEYYFELSNPEKLKYKPFCESMSAKVRGGVTVFDTEKNPKFPFCTTDPGGLYIENYGNGKMVLYRRFID